MIEKKPSTDFGSLPDFDARYGDIIPFKKLPHTVQHAFADLVPKKQNLRSDGASPAYVFREIPQTEHPVWQQVKIAAQELGYELPKHVYVVHANTANAFGDAPTQTILITQGAIEALDPDALRVVIRHELRHLNQPESEKLEPLEDVARELYDPKGIPHGTMLPYNWAHSVLMAIQRTEGEAIAAEAANGKLADDAIRSSLQMMKWNILLPNHMIAGRCIIDHNAYEALYLQLIRPQASTFFEGEADMIDLARKSNWQEFVDQAPPFYLCAVVDTMDEVLETGAMRPPGEWCTEAMGSHPSHSERYAMVRDAGDSWARR